MLLNQKPGKIILINGATSAGKSTLALSLQDDLDEPFWHFSIDHLRDSKVLPDSRIQNGDFEWSAMRPDFFNGFHRCLPAVAAAGNNLIIEHIIETREWMDLLLSLLSPFDVFFIGIHCPLAELERREILRGNRPIGGARADYENIHTFGHYDLELESTVAMENNRVTALEAWINRKTPSAFTKMVNDKEV